MDDVCLTDSSRDLLLVWLSFRPSRLDHLRDLGKTIRTLPDAYSVHADAPWLYMQRQRLLLFDA